MPSNELLLDPGPTQKEVGFGFFGNQWSNSNWDGITAAAAGTQSAAPKLDRMISRITTVASIGASVALPVARAGHEVCVINAGANAMQVFAALSDPTCTINGTIGTTGLSQQANSIVFYVCPVDHVWIASGIAGGYSGGFATYSSQVLTANTNNSQTLATPITAMQAEVQTAAGNLASVLLPAAAAGMEIVILNNSTNIIAVYGTGTNTINGSASSTMGTGSVVQYFAFNSGSWFTK